MEKQVLLNMNKKANSFQRKQETVRARPAVVPFPEATCTIPAENTSQERHMP